MPVKTYRNGDYRLVVATESSSRPDVWYRVLQDTSTGNLQCDCPNWLTNANRTCKHTDAGRLLLGAGNLQASGTVPSIPDAQRLAALTHPLVEATRGQWQGIETATFGIEERDSMVGRDPYHFVLLRVQTGDDIQASAVVAFARRHFQAGTDPHVHMQTGVVGWAGYELCSRVARAADFPMVGQPPIHYRMPRRAPMQPTGRAQQQSRLLDEPEYGVADLLKIGERKDLGDGLTPKQRAEGTLRLFLGPLYQQVQTQGYLDVPSARVTNRVYRVRRDSSREIERRVRVIENGRYTNDLCIIRTQSVPEADHFMTVFLRLISDERGLLDILKGQEVIGQPYGQRGNVFTPHSEDTSLVLRADPGASCLCESDGRPCPCHRWNRGQLETEPAQWRARTIAAVA